MAPKRVFLLRHGQGFHNATGDDIPDALLTEDGITQATSWQQELHKLDIDVVLISPLRRTLQTACYAFSGSAKNGCVGDGSGGMEVCRHARELWWSERVNHFSSLSKLQELLETLPRGGEVRGLTEALPNIGQPDSEQASVSAMRAVLQNREENTVAVVTHWGVINGLCGASAKNCDLVECEFRETKKGKLEMKVVAVHNPPGGPRTM